MSDNRQRCKVEGCNARRAITSGICLTHLALRHTDIESLRESSRNFTGKGIKIENPDGSYRVLIY